MNAVLIALGVWVVLSVAVALVTGRGIRQADEREGKR